MSDEEFEFQYSDDEGGDGGGGGGGDVADSLLVNVENTYYSTKACVGVDDEGAYRGFAAVLEMVNGAAPTPALTEWAYKCTKQLVKACCRTARYDEMLTWYRALLRRILDGEVTKNRAEKAVTGILDLVTSSTEGVSGSATAASGEGRSAATASTLSAFYGATLDALSGPGNERLGFKTRMKQARLHLATGNWAALEEVLTTTRKALEGGGGDMQAVGTQLIEVHALRLQRAEAVKDPGEQAAAYAAASDLLRTAVPHPGITGIVHEAGGKIAMRQRDWENARIRFLEGRGRGAKRWRACSTCCSR